MINHYTLAQYSRKVYNDFDFVIKGIEIKRRENIYTFRGTKGRWDILRDIRFLPWYSEEVGAFAPAGFVRASDDIMRYILRQHHTEPLIFNGHSLGGAVALLVAAMLHNVDEEISQVVTFGSPKVGKLVTLKDVDVTLYKHGRDFITRIPLGFGHCRRLTKIGKKGGLLKDHFMDNYLRELHGISRNW